MNQRKERKKKNRMRKNQFVSTRKNVLYTKATACYVITYIAQVQPIARAEESFISCRFLYVHIWIWSPL